MNVANPRTLDESLTHELAPKPPFFRADNTINMLIKFERSTYVFCMYLGSCSIVYYLKII
jgi:hypothetical protein